MTWPYATPMWTLLSGLAVWRDLATMVHGSGWLVAMTGEVLEISGSNECLSLLIVQCETGMLSTEVLACIGALGFDILDADSGYLHNERGQALDLRWILQ